MYTNVRLTFTAHKNCYSLVLNIFINLKASISHPLSTTYLFSFFYQFDNDYILL